MWSANAAVFRTRRIDFGRGPTDAMTIPWGDIATAYRSTGIPNIRVYTATSERTVRWMRHTRFLVPALTSRLGGGEGRADHLGDEAVTRSVDGGELERLLRAEVAMHEPVVDASLPGDVADGAVAPIRKHLDLQRALDVTDGFGQPLAAFGEAERPRLVLGVSDPHGIRSVSPLVASGAERPFAPGSGDSAVAAGVHVLLPELRAAEARSLDFAYSLLLAGSGALAVAPLGSNTSVTMRSDWAHPSFAGRFLPLKHEIGAEGFSAEWKVSQYAAPGTANRQELAVSFIEPAGLYQQLERASKYGFLFIGLTFAAFLLFELLRRLAIHPIQYLLVGLALAMFFLLLTALSEHIPFAAAYAIATFSCVGLISVYLVRVLRSAFSGLAFGTALAALYAMLYALLKAEDYSLIGGSLLLFGLLAVVMLATRRVDWYASSAARGTT